MYAYNRKVKAKFKLIGKRELCFNVFSNKKTVVLYSRR